MYTLSQQTSTVPGTATLETNGIPHLVTDLIDDVLQKAPEVKALICNAGARVRTLNGGINVLPPLSTNDNWWWGHVGAWTDGRTVLLKVNKKDWGHTPEEWTNWFARGGD